MVTIMNRTTDATPVESADSTEVQLNLRIAQQVLHRVAADPFFAGAALSSFERRCGLEEDQLADFLGCDVAQLSRLALFRCPDPDSPRFGEQVQRMADRTGADAIKLATVLLCVSP